MDSRLAISALLKPSTNKARMSISRGVSLLGLARVAGLGPLDSPFTPPRRIFSRSTRAAGCAPAFRRSQAPGTELPGLLRPTPSPARTGSRCVPIPPARQSHTMIWPSCHASPARRASSYTWATSAKTRSRSPSHQAASARAAATGPMR